MTNTTIEFINEFALSTKDKGELSELLPLCFPETNYFGLYYFKQLPHHRLLIRGKGMIIGQVGIDYRVMNMNGTLVNIWGVVDLVVHPEHRGMGQGAALMSQLYQVANANKENIDFIFLVTDQPAFYEKLGYERTNPKMTWLKLYHGKTYGIGNEQIADSILMYKKVSGKEWQEGELDLMGYMY